MLIQLFLLFFLLCLLFLISKRITTNIYQLSFRLFKNKRVAVWFLAIIVLPGTIIHELSHFLLASILRVQTGELSIFPKIDKNSQVRAGHLEISKTDPFRLTLIGLAPILIGLMLIYLIGNFFLPARDELFNYLFQIDNLLFLFSIFYILFSISSTMFSSKKDLESLLYVGPVVLLVLGALYLTGVRVVFEEPLVGKITAVLSVLNFYLLLTAIIDYSALITSTLILRMSSMVNR